MIRFARIPDMAAMLEIYASYIDTPITFECELPEEQVFAKRMTDISVFYPCLACEEQGRIISYAYAHRPMAREAYQWNAELSVYLDPFYTSRGLGKKLYSVLMEILRLQGIRTVYGCVTVPNEKSEALHEGLGFRIIGTYCNAGYKAGKWQDVRWFEKAIAPYNVAPAPAVSMDAIPEESLRKIMSSFQ